jgi:hypothetical protein
LSRPSKSNWLSLWKMIIASNVEGGIHNTYPTSLVLKPALI